MSVPARSRQARERRRSRTGPVLAGLLAALVALAIGIALGRSLAEGPRGDATVTSVRTLDPRRLPAPPRTVTITVTAAETS